MNILDTIKECERGAAELRADAASAARETAREWSRRSDKEAKELFDDAAAYAVEALESARSASQRKAAQFIAASAAEDEKLVEAAAARLDKAVGLICEGVLSQ